MLNPRFRPITGRHAGWGLISSSLRIRPYTLTPGATDTMQVRVREKIDIEGVGTDVVEMVGTFTVRRDHPHPANGNGEVEWGKSIVRTEFRALELTGESELFGTVRVHLDPKHVSHGEVGTAEARSEAAKCAANLHPVIELPELDMVLQTGGEAVTLRSKVIQIPPVGDVARSDNSVALVDEEGNRIGEMISSDVEVGEVLASIPLGVSQPRGEEGEAPATGRSKFFYTRKPS